MTREIMVDKIIRENLPEPEINYLPNKKNKPDKRQPNDYYIGRVFHCYDNPETYIFTYYCEMRREFKSINVRNGEQGPSCQIDFIISNPGFKWAKNE